MGKQTPRKTSLTKKGTHDSSYATTTISRLAYTETKQRARARIIKKVKGQLSGMGNKTFRDIWLKKA